MGKPIIGITCDTVADHTPQKWKYESPHEYARDVARAGGVPFLLPYEFESIPDFLSISDGLLLSGGDDPDLTEMGQPVHASAKVMHIMRQRFELALLKALDATRHPVLGVCLGMQLMSIHAGGKLHQHLPEAEGIGPDAASEHDRKLHTVELLPGAERYRTPGHSGHSRHHQGVADAGSLRVIARYGNVIEAVARPEDDRYYLGIQWHPECTEDAEYGLGLIRRFVAACRRDQPHTKKEGHAT